MTRPRTAGTGRRQTKYIRFAVDYTHKSRILDRLAEEVKVATVIEEFYPSISKQKGNGKQISKLKGQAGFIQNVCDEGKGHLQNYCRNGDATVLSAEAENDIVLWLNSIWKEGCPVSTEMLELKALEIAADTGIDPDVFSASYSWRRRFMRKHKLSIRARTRQGQTTPDDAAAARAKFKGEVRAAILKHNISNVFNADQTLSSLDIFLALQSQKGGQKMVWVKCSGRDKERATVMLLADWHGNKRAPFLVFKSGVSHHNHVQDINDTKRHGFGVRLWHEISQLQHQHGCQIYGNISACWNAPISLKVSEYHFGDRDDMDEKILLLWDDFSGHWTQALMEYAVSISVILLKLPPRNAYVCKSADVAWNQPFKPCICSRWVDCLRAQIAEHHALEKRRAAQARKIAHKSLRWQAQTYKKWHEKNIQELQQGLASRAFEMVAPKRPDIASWIAESWTYLTATTIVSGFSKPELLGDYRNVENTDEENDVDKISALLDHLADLGAVNEAVDTDDEFVSSESSDDE